MPHTVKEALEILESGNWCSLRLITANTAQRTGGKILELAKVRIKKQEPHQASVSPSPVTSKPKAQNHHQHFTRNVETQARQVIKVHPILITHINNTPVI